MTGRFLISALVLLSSFAAASPTDAFAAPSTGSVKRSAKQEARAVKKLVSQFKKLSLQKRAEVINSLKTLDDSDNDGIPNILETNERASCDADSDNDGLDDGDEYQNGTNPNRPDSDGDGVDDGEDDDGNGDGNDDSAEIEVKGLLVSSSPSSAVVGTTTFVLNGSTQYRQGSTTTGLTIDNFAIGSCVEIKGTRTGSENIAVRVKSDNDCGEDD